MAKKRKAQPLTIPSAAAYLQSPPRIAVILGSFAVIALPLVVLQFVDIDPTVRFTLSVAYAVLLGGTHFLITLAVYGQSENLRYFTSSTRNTLIYFVVPASLLTLFFLISRFGLDKRQENWSLGLVLGWFLFTIAVRAADFFHVVRQSFGMLQLFKTQTPATFPPWMRRADNTFFVSMAGLQLLTAVRGMRTDHAVFEPDVLSLIALAVIVVSLGAVLTGFASAAGHSKQPRALWVPLTYFLFQGASASLAAWRTEFYTASLAMHYVEYHVIIYPRLFGSPLDPESRVDRVAGWMRRHKLVFYGALALLACFVSRELWPAIADRAGSPGAPWLLFNLLNGIFVTHYFIEAFIWKFREPYYRQSLGPLYFPQRTPTTSS
jgi:hypothetical protein